jgi:hypothetical protein
VRRRILALLEEGEGLSLAEVAGMGRELLELQGGWGRGADALGPGR